MFFTRLFSNISLIALLNATWISAEPAPRIIRDDQPGTRWADDAFPVGNGRLGAMVFGGVDRERIQFNVDSLWSGDDNPSGDYKSMGTYLNFGDLFITRTDAAPAAGQPVCSSGHTPFYEPQGVQASADGSAATKWCVEHQGRPVVWQRTLPSPRTIPFVTLTSGDDVPARDPTRWTLEGSVDGKNWTPLLAHTQEAPFAERGQERRFPVPGHAPVAQVRITFQPNPSVTHFQVAEIQLGEDSGQGAESGAPQIRYARTLDLATGLAEVQFHEGGTSHHRTLFASHPHQVLAWRWTADTPGAIQARIELVSAQGAATQADGNRLEFAGSLANGLKYHAVAEVIALGGEVAAREGGLDIRGADAVTLLLSAATDYRMEAAAGLRGQDPAPVNRGLLDNARQLGWNALRDRHLADHQALFGRVSVDWGSSDPALASKPTRARIAAYRDGGEDPDLEELLFQFGRYLLMGSSRSPGLPANLQGLWNDSNTPPWHSDYHSNINVQMNYWLAEPANLAECHRPFILLVDAIREPSRRATQAAFGEVRGWTARTSHNPFGGHGWKWNIPASAWYMQHVWEHYDFGRDRDYLAQVAYPMMKEVCHFWEDHLKALPDGRLVVPNGWSPEHGPTEDGVAHDQQIVWDLFNNTIQAAEILGIDAEYRARLTGLRDRLVGPQIGRWGQLMEWMEDRDDPDTRHRHTSHLYAVYPGRQISVENTPEFAKAAEISLDARGETGDSRRSWTWAWRTALWARFGNPERAYGTIRGLLTYNTLDNLLATHPPLQMDGNFGITAGICETLLQSHAGVIHLLPALPPPWKNGEVKGLRARGDVVVDMAWKNGVLTEAVLTAGAAGEVELRYGDHKWRMLLPPGKPTRARLP